LIVKKSFDSISATTFPGSTYRRTQREVRDLLESVQIKVGKESPSKNMHKEIQR